MAYESKKERAMQDIANAKKDRTIVSKEPFIPQLFEELHDAFMTPDKQESYERAVKVYKNMTDVHCSKISYMSDGLKVTGFILEPKDIPPNAQLPVIIYCRGGSNDDGKITVMTIVDTLSFFVRQGYIVIASQYRGNDGSEGNDELGGADVNDVINLMQVAQNIEYADMKNVFIFGYSRGGMMTYMALRKQIPIRAAAIGAGVTDYFSLEQNRSDLIPLFNQMMPNMPEDKEHQYIKRSAVCWADEINVPVLILHGQRDTVIGVEQSERLVKQLAETQKKHLFCMFTQ